MNEQEARKLLGGKSDFFPNDRDILAGGVSDNYGYVEERKKQLLKEQKEKEK